MSESPLGRPTTVAGAFYCWVAAAVLVAALGLLFVSGQSGLAPKLIGLILILVGLVLAFLADRARRGDIRFARAALGLSMSAVAFLGLLTLVLMWWFAVVAIVVIVLLLIGGAVLNQRRTSQRWYEEQSA